MTFVVIVFWFLNTMWQLKAAETQKKITLKQSHPVNSAVVGNMNLQ